jgi:hypothetical protein
MILSTDTKNHALIARDRGGRDEIGNEITWAQVHIKIVLLVARYNYSIKRSTY